MDVRHDDDEVEQMETDPDYTGGWDRAVVRAVRKCLNLVRAVPLEKDLYSFRGLRYERLKGSRSHQRSMRLNRQWRLIVEIEDVGESQIVVVKGIEDYH